MMRRQWLLFLPECVTLFPVRPPPPRRGRTAQKVPRIDRARRDPYMEIIQQQIFDQERALYGSRDLLVKDCSFDGPADGESAFKECSDIQVERCFFNLRYPLLARPRAEALRLGADGPVPGRPVVLRPHRDHRHQAPRHQGPAGVPRGCSPGLRRHLPGVRLVFPAGADGGLHRRERVLHDAGGGPPVQKCPHEREVLLPVHPERRLRPLRLRHQGRLLAREKRGGPGQRGEGGVPGLVLRGRDL